MKFKSMADIQAALPLGIKVHWVKGQLHYTVRSSKKGRKVSLGTYLSPELAMRALANFKAGLPIELTQAEITQISNEQAAREAEKQRNQIERGIAQVSKQDMFFILHNEVPPHEIDSSKPYQHLTNDGKLIIIPKAIVAEYILALAEGAFTESEFEYLESPEDKPKDEAIWHQDL